MSGAETLVGDAAAAASRGAERLVPGASVGRYIVLEELGMGAMGVVYGAYDPELDRKVALKLLLPDRATPTNASGGHARLIREAQAIARIDHPNVVSVHDVGRYRDATFVAMEFVEGIRLSQWMAADHAESEIVSMFVAAGRGLAAAHAQGVVHRDFKPDNVLVDTGGRPRVVDFGLARRDRAASDSVEDDGNSGSAAGPLASGVSALDVDLTAVGSVMGTPAYMAPEQHRGSQADARTDQFAVCVALYEALYGERPFYGDRIETLVSHVCSGRVSPPPDGSRVSPRLRRVLLKGLRADPDERFDSMTALVHELQGNYARRSTLVFAGLGAGAIGLLALVVHQTVNESDPCEGVGDGVEQVWNGDRAATVAEAFSATDLAYAEGTAAKVRARLDAYADAWSSASHDACTAVRVTHALGEDVLALQEVCLRDGLQRLDAWVEVLESADAAVVERAVAGSHSLPSVESCRDGEKLRSGVRPPDGPALKAAVDTIAEELAAVEALTEAGRYAAAEAKARPLAERARTAGYPPIHARAVHVLSNAVCERDTREGLALLRETFAVALEARSDRLAAIAALGIGYQLGYQERREEDGERWLQIAAALINRIGGDPELELGLENHRAVFASLAGQVDEARAAFERGLAIRRARDPDDPKIAQALANLGSLHATYREFDKAMPYFNEAIAVSERALGAGHPITLPWHANAGMVALMRGDYIDARARLSVTLGRQIATMGEDHPETANTMAALGAAESHLGGFAEAVRLQRRALAIREKVLGPDNPAVAESLIHLAQSLARNGARDEDVLGMGQRALALLVGRLSPDDPAIANAHEVVARIYLRLERWADAEQHAAEAVRILETIGGEQTGRLAAPLRALANARRELHHPDRARILLERALAISIEVGNPEDVANCQYALAVTLVALGEDAERAHELAQSAHAVIASVPGRAEYAAEIAAWIAQHSQR